MNPRERELVEAYKITAHAAWFSSLGEVPAEQHPLPPLPGVVGRERAGWLIWLHGSAERALERVRAMPAWFGWFAAPADVRDLLEQARERRA